MPTDYTSHRFPTSFIRSDESQIQNGSLALANTAHTIAENQHWNVLKDLPFCHFLVQAENSYNKISVPVDGVTNNTITVPVRVPPFSTHAEFYFYYYQDFDSSGTATTVNYIEVASPVDTYRATNLPYGEDTDGTANPFPTYPSSGWCFFSGIPNEITLDTAPSAVPLVSTMSATWQTVDVTITASPDVMLTIGAYRVLPNIRALDMDV